jgi:hypothetical protein
MIKKILIYTITVFLLLFLVKAFFFSGITRPYAQKPPVTKAKEPGYVWASAGAQYERSWLGRFFLGDHYRSVWATPVKAPVLDLNTIAGGLRVGEMGGGMQTTSLSLTDSTGQTWVIRSVDKDPIETLSPFWQKTFVADLIRDQIAASNPYGALVVAPLAEAAGIFHTDPSIVFVSASDPKIQQYREQIGDELHLLEEKFTSKSTADPRFSGATAIVKSLEMLNNRFQNPAHRIDQQAFARCRLFDLFIGDWDRHEGQWMWAAYNQNGNLIYKPVPKDRDQAFSKYQDGLIPWLLTRNFALRKFGHFDYQLHDVTDYSINASFLDERALNQVTLAEFKQQAQRLQASLTDQVIDAAVKQLPAAVYAVSGQELAAKLKSRRRGLLQVATNYYYLLAKKVVIPGTDSREKFAVTRLPNGRTQVKVYELTPTDSVGHLLYQRTFLQAETKDITLHGLAGDDQFVLTGKVNEGLKVNIVGGLGADYMADYSAVATGSKKTVIYDTRQGNTIIWGSTTENQTTKDLAVHNYDREGF